MLQCSYVINLDFAEHANLLTREQGASLNDEWLRPLGLLVVRRSWGDCGFGGGILIFTPAALSQCSRKSEGRRESRFSTRPLRHIPGGDGLPPVRYPLCHLLIVYYTRPSSTILPCYHVAGFYFGGSIISTTPSGSLAPPICYQSGGLVSISVGHHQSPRIKVPSSSL